MSSQPRPWLSRGQRGRWGGGGSGDSWCPGAPPPSPPPILSMQPFIAAYNKLNSRRRWPESAISGVRPVTLSALPAPPRKKGTRQKPPPIVGRDHPPSLEGCPSGGGGLQATKVTHSSFPPLEAHWPPFSSSLPPHWPRRAQMSGARENCKVVTAVQVQPVWGAGREGGTEGGRGRGRGNRGARQ